VKNSTIQTLHYDSKQLTIRTGLLKREVTVELILPAGCENTHIKYPLLILNDGQDNEAVDLLKTLERLAQKGFMRDIIVAGVHAGDRLQEYGVSSKPDYQKRGSRARQYTRFVIEELMPYLIDRYPVSQLAVDHAIAGYSMGGLSAVDIAWSYPKVFSKAGAFSGSFWWRKRDTKSRLYSDERDRILHLEIRNGKFKRGLKFWFQAGTHEEKSDRNHNGVIDAIDDTLDLIVELTKKGYRPYHDIRYVETPGGEHNHNTWKKVMPDFLLWAFGKK
jgi:enterochelin esterase-like enzyme